MANTMSASKLDKNILEQIIYYDDTSPSFLRWKIYKGSRAPKDGVAGCMRKDGYWVIHINSILYLVHRIVWALHADDEVASHLVINHIDINPSNNNISNLELCSRMTNLNKTKMQTRVGLRITNTSGINGINELTTATGYKYASVYLVVHGIKYQKKFSYLKLGKDKAWEEALIYKESLYQ
jgi:hypothetical protein